MIQGLNPKSKAKLVLPMNFISENNYCLKINSLNNEIVEGSFSFQHYGTQTTYAIKSFVYQSKDGKYHFTFSIDWKHVHTSSYTMFSADLQITENQCQISLKWLLVSGTETENQIKLKGHSQLYPEVETLNNSISEAIPYPIEAFQLTQKINTLNT